MKQLCVEVVLSPVLKTRISFVSTGWRVSSARRTCISAHQADLPWNRQYCVVFSLCLDSPRHGPEVLRGSLSSDSVCSSHLSQWLSQAVQRTLRELRTHTNPALSCQRTRGPVHCSRGLQMCLRMAGLSGQRPQPVLSVEDGTCCVSCAQK